MLITNIRYGRTINLGNYESEKLEVEIIPEAGQTAEAALDEVRQYVDSKTAKSAVNGNGKSAPLAGGASGPAGGASKGNAKAAPPASEQPPFAAESVPPTSGENEPKPKKARAPKKQPGKPEHGKQLLYAADSESLEELLERFNNLRELSSKFSLDDWEAACARLKETYRRCMSAAGMSADPEVQQQIIAAFKAERNYINEHRDGSCEA